MNFSLAEENYLKAIYHLSQGERSIVSTNAIAEELQTSPASVTDMVKKLSSKKTVDYIKYKGVNMTEQGEKIALWIIRKHRLWEVFLVEKLKFTWDEVHEVAEQLEHIRSRRLIERLDDFLGYPKTDPHGDPIPDQDGNITAPTSIPLSETAIYQTVRVIAVRDTSSAFLKYLDKIGVGIGTKLVALDKIEFDSSLEIKVFSDQESSHQVMMSSQVAGNILVN